MQLFAKNVIHTFSTYLFPHLGFCARLKGALGISPLAYRHSDTPTTTERPISSKKSLILTQFEAPDQVSASNDQVKYSYFSMFTSKKRGKAVFGVLATFGLIFMPIMAISLVPLKAEASIIGRVLAIFYSEASAEEALLDKNEQPEKRSTQSLPLLEGAVNIDPNPSKEGGGITVINDTALSSNVGPSGTLADIETRDRQGVMTTYKVHRGETITQIAKMFGVSADTIMWANDIERGTALREGQTLVILPMNGVLYTVKSGDTLSSIAKKYKGDINEILEYNDTGGSTTLVPGDTLLIPNGENNITKTTSPKTTATPRFASYPTYSGYYLYPLQKGVRTQGIHGHNGVDFGAPRGTPVYASADGVVKVSNYRDGNPWFGGYGNYIMIEHPNGTQTLYAHLSGVDASVGDTVRQGQVIGKTGNTGRSTGPHLHFEVRGAKNPF